MAKKTKATFTQRRGSRDKGAYNANHNTLEATRKGQSHIDEERMHLNKYIRFDRNGRPHVSQGGNGGFNATQHERERYEELYGKGLEARNQRYLASRHKERCRTMSEVYQDLKTAPLESIWQVGNSKSDMSREEMRDALVQAWNLTYRELREKYGENMVPLSAALHMDEKVCHIHYRVTLGAMENGFFMPNQTKALEQMGFERPDPTKPRSRYNNALIAFTDSIRETFYQYCERCGLEIDREVQNYSKRQVEILELKCDKFREEMAEAKRQAEIQQEAAKQAEIVLGQTQQSIKELNAKIIQLTAENTGLKVENEALKHQLADLNRQIDEAKQRQEQAEQKRDTAVKKLEEIEDYQKGLFRQWQSRQVRTYGELPAEKEKKNWKGQITKPAMPARTIVATEDLERMKTQAQYIVTAHYKKRSAVYMGRKKKLVNNTTIPQYAVERFARCVFDDIRADYARPEIQAEFALWLAEREAHKKTRAAKSAALVSIMANKQIIRTRFRFGRYGSDYFALYLDSLNNTRVQNQRY